MTANSSVANLSIEEVREQIDRPSCKFCNETDQDSLEQHHVVPRRHGGEDTEENLVTLCASCHRKIESLYNKRFYEAVNSTEDKFECPYCQEKHRNHQRHKEHVMRCFN